MKLNRLIFFCLVTALLLLCHPVVNAQLGVRYDPSVQQTSNLQYFKPKGDLFVGDCIPFAHNGTYYWYWLLDSAHHKSLNGLGGHQWALSTSTDLKSWKHYPVVLGIDEAWEKSICTGSVVFYKGLFYAFYATRLINSEGHVNEQLSYATSKDGIHFEKQRPNPFYTSAPGYSKRDFRDPKVVVDEKTGEFHLFVSSWKEGFIPDHAGGCLVHLVSKDLKDWKVLEPILTGQPSVPECPDYFFWKGWYYLVYSDGSDTYYVKSKNPYGPWSEPSFQSLNESWANVVKTAAFKNDRRIAAAWIPNRNNNKDNEHEIFGGNAVFREVMQLPDGTLTTKFPEELIPSTGAALPVKITAGVNAAAASGTLTITAPGAVGAASISDVPAQCRITMEVEPTTALEEFGLIVRSDDKAGTGYRFNINPNTGIVSLGNTDIKAVTGLDKPIKADIILRDDIIDVCIDGRRCIVNRTPEQKGNYLWFYGKHGTVTFRSVKIFPLTGN
ncbi:family 43 glycosylhydrolase [Flavihumibacter petaseus]|uniref:beta-fructofuranosidase n=1 Tax=Flavihumibacter petaseus NBRC 106054 TaxID=1220578 RepID=A0A0E9N7U7_9BACT|nr:family 43 glycosylhydrolase [Flavihumibacter petaseus]GAO45435.1 putative glycosidase [Flavihumibacter petaseus NBRC 106054]